MYKIGLVGLPNVGKSSIFNFLTGNNALVSNRPFSTIKPNISLFEMFDFRIEDISNYNNSISKSFSSIELVDIAGLIKGSHEKSHGNEFFSKIKEVDLIIHVLRLFSRNDIFHVLDNINPLEDFKIINTEFILHDYQQIENILKRTKNKNDDKKELTILRELSNYLNKGILLNEINFSQEEKKIIKKHNLLTIKPCINLINCDNDDLELEKNKKVVKNFSDHKINDLFFFDLLNEIEKKSDKKKIKLDSLSATIKKKLNLKSFFTTGPKETKSWLAKIDMNAYECSGLIHSEIKKKFIRVEVYNYQDWKKEKNINELKKKIIKREKREYLIKDGDICLFL